MLMQIKDSATEITPSCRLIATHGNVLTNGVSIGVQPAITYCLHAKDLRLYT